MQSNNPVFRRSEAFSGSGAHGTQSYGNSGYGSDPSQWGVGAPGDTQGYAPAPQAPSAPMTIDSVVQKTGITLGVVVVAALATWVMLPEINEDTASSALGTVSAVATFGFLGAFVLSLVNSFKKVVSPPLVLAFAALEGIALGAISMLFNVAYPGAVQGAVIGTFAAFAGTLAAYKILNIQVGDKFRKFVVAAVFGMIGLSLMELVLGLFGAQIGLFGVSGLGMVTAVAGLVLGVFMLIMDFDFVEQGIRYGAPERESWTAAFAMTVSLVWIYTNLLRIMAFFSQE
ncbi:unannotated protein [freshwater metagenome]|uniref:Unannotated protein n=1 Tax=freshwater metagenome TaxID=449393 RepID=A0A6J6VXF3_9ZZZZ|nr:hypothetical protein [Actinomycetota bacterium]